jgi:hypothetical protein
MYRDVLHPGTNVFGSISCALPLFFFLTLFFFLFFLFSLFSSFILQSFRQRIHTSHIHNKIICTTDYNNDLIQPNHSHKIHKLQHQFDTMNHSHTGMQPQEHKNHIFLISQEHNVNKGLQKHAWPCASTTPGSRPLPGRALPPCRGGLRATAPLRRVGRPPRQDGAATVPEQPPLPSALRLQAGRAPPRHASRPVGPLRAASGPSTRSHSCQPLSRQVGPSRLAQSKSLEKEKREK